MSETLAQEFSRLVGEYNDDDAGDATKAEAWNYIADFAVENSHEIASALAALAPQQAAPMPGVKEYLARNARNGWTGRGLSFDPGFLNLDREGAATIGFAESDMQYERADDTGKDYVYCNVPLSEIIALRDYLNEAFPTTREAGTSEPVADGMGEFRPCIAINEDAGVTEAVFEDVAYIAEPVFHGVHHWIDKHIAIDDGRLVGMTVWKTHPAPAQAPVDGEAVLVPRHPTPEMLATFHGLNRTRDTKSLAARTYKTMLAAAPSARKEAE